MLYNGRVILEACRGSWGRLPGIVATRKALRKFIRAAENNHRMSVLRGEQSYTTFS